MIERHLELQRRVADDRLEVAAVILAMNAGDEHPGGEEIHFLQEQAVVGQAKNVHAQVLAALLRGGR
ncbi:hypothetical protein ACIQVK_18880 [Streptomyces sp. NPDC090493]|uniref:hypothetical protein n=1 Tax=Streptomyces sp. NPDC090493 TaxID=3365964 RepID=UPI003806A9C3